MNDSEHMGQPDAEQYAPHSELPNLVLCFDRDYTVSVNPPPPSHGKAVPLAWIKYLAHDNAAQTVDVWATGNQHLRAEAAIPGFHEAIDCWERLTEQSVFDEYDRLHVKSEKPTRRDGLRLIADLYRYQQPSNSSKQRGNKTGDAPIIAVVDDVDLGDLQEEGIEYFYPDVFAMLVEESNGAPEILDETSVRLPLDKLPEAITKDMEPPSSDGFTYTNQPINSDTDKTDRNLTISHYDPTRLDRP